MPRVAILAHGAHYHGSRAGALQTQIERAFTPLRARIGDSARVAVSFTASKINFDCWQRGDLPGALPDAPARELARKFRIGGRLVAPNAACASGAHAIAVGAQWVVNGDADLVLCGAIEPPQHPVVMAAYRNMGALSRGGTMRPFDARRDGFVTGEGGAYLVLASEDWAHQHGAEIRAYLDGWSFGCDATHITQMVPDGSTIERAIDEALKCAGNPCVDYINAHGTATINDAIEARALNRVFGDEVAVSSTKPLTGHLLGAAGAVEAVLCLDAMQSQIAPPTLNLEAVDEQIELDLVRGQGRAMAIDAALSLNYGFGGHIGCLVFGLK